MTIGEPPPPSWPNRGSSDPALHATMKHIEELLEKLVENTTPPPPAPDGYTLETKDCQAAIQALKDYTSRGGET